MMIVRIVLSPEAEVVYAFLEENSSKDKTCRIVLRSFNKKKEILRNDIHYGDPIPKNLIPKIYYDGHSITKLFRIELAGYWRSLYTITEGRHENEISIVILSILNHGAYDRLFGYSGI